MKTGIRLKCSFVPFGSEPTMALMIILGQVKEEGKEVEMEWNGDFDCVRTRMDR